MPVRKKIMRRKKVELTGAEELFLYGKTDKPVNPFEMLDLEYPVIPKARAKVEALNLLKSG